MTPAARVQSAIELLDAIITAARNNGAPADRIIADWARANRYAGSKDRRAIRNLVYDTIRLCGPVPANGRAAMIAVAQKDDAIGPLFDGSRYGPAALKDNEQAAKTGIACTWLKQKLAQSDIAQQEMAALLERAPLDIRVNTLKADRAMLELPVTGEHLASDAGLRLPTDTRIDAWPAYLDGLIEVQDHASQWACAVVGAKPGETIIDLCAGAGGKALALAAAMDNKGILIASDTDRARLSRLMPRARRAGAQIIETILLNPRHELDALSSYAGKADAVLVDAPCSGSGAWRRNPDGRWRIDKNSLNLFAATQDYLLDIATTLVAPSGRLIFVTCSLFDEEGADRIKAFCNRHNGWESELPDIPVGQQRGNGLGKGLRLTPYHDDTDGFFIASLQRAC